MSAGDIAALVATRPALPLPLLRPLQGGALLAVSANGIAQIVFYLVVLTVLTPPLGAFIARVYEGKRIPGLSTVLGPVERGTYRLLRIDPEREQNWKGYAGSVLVFSAVGFVLLYLILRLQGHLPLNPLRPAGDELERRLQHVGQLHHQHQLAVLRRRVDAELPEPDAGARRCRTSSRPPSAWPSWPPSSAASPAAAPGRSATSGPTWCASPSTCCCPWPSSGR